MKTIDMYLTKNNNFPEISTNLVKIIWIRGDQPQPKLVFKFCDFLIFWVALLRFDENAAQKFKIFGDLFQMQPRDQLDLKKLKLLVCMRRCGCVLCIFVLVCRQFSSILTLLFKHSGKFEGVWKFVFKKPSYKFVYGFKLKINELQTCQLN